MSRSLSCLGLAALMCALPAFGQRPQDEYEYQEPIAKKGQWNFSLDGMPTTLECQVKGFANGILIDIDTQQDLALGKSKMSPGVSLEYMGPRIGMQFGVRNQKHEGNNIIKRDIIHIGGQPFTIGMPVQSEIKSTTYDINMTIRMLNFEQGWIGMDLGVHVWRLEFQAQSSALSMSAVKQLLPTVPAPQFGISAGTSLLDDRLQAKAHFHFLGWKGAKYQRIQADVRYFPLDWLGVRVYTDNEHFDLPIGSIWDQLDILADSKGVGFGVVLKF